MKKTLSAILLSCFCMTAISQTRVGEDRQTIYPYDFQEYDKNLPEKLRPVTKRIEDGARFSIVDESAADYYVIYSGSGKIL